MTKPTDDSTRSFARVDVTLPVRIRPINDQQARQLAERLDLEPTYTERLSTAYADRSGGEKSWERLALLTLLERMEKLEQGLERVAGSLGVSLNEPDSWVEGQSISLSGSGMGIHMPCSFDEETLVEVEVTLLGETTGIVRLLGKIVALAKPDGDKIPVGRHHLGVRFDVFNEEDREAIVHYTFRLQRAQLRDLRDDD